MAELQRTRIDARHGAQDVKPGAGAQLVLKGRVTAAMGPLRTPRRGYRLSA
jgi:hypothetical protein